MRAKSVVGVLIAGAVLVGGLVAMLLRDSGAAEPSFQPTAASAEPPLEAVRPSSADAGAEARPAREGPELEVALAAAESDPAPESDREREPESDPDPESDREPESDPDPEAQPARTLDCEHPFIPTAPGEWRRYAWRQSTEEETALLRIEARSVRDVERGEREITWRIELTASDDAELAREEMTTRCAPGQAAEEPWFGILERSLGLRVTGAPRWRWPAHLRAGARFEGVATFDTRGADMRAPEGADGPMHLRVTRRHVVGERESVEVPAGRWRAWRVDYEEEHAFGERGERGTGTAWIAPSVGMIRSTAENSSGVRQTIELLALGS